MGGVAAAWLYSASLSLSSFPVGAPYTVPTGAWYGWFGPE